jgi:hypothetical protein
VNLAYREHYDLLISSGLYGALSDEGLMVRHEEVDVPAAANGAYRVLRPERIGFVSYPYEWCFGELKAAALATLRIQSLALDHGMSLRDASAYNVQFRAGGPVLIDTLSFERLREGKPWVAYRQFCQHFLAPLALMAYGDIRLGQLSRVHIDGVPLDLAAALLPRQARRRPTLLMHVVAHARSQAKHAGTPTRSSEAAGRRTFGLRAFRGLIDSLTSAVGKLSWDPGSSAWSGYYADAESYTEEATRRKQELIGSFLDEAQPPTVWDLGGNTGLFGRLASDRGIPTVCFDADPACVEANYREVVAKSEANMLPIVMDLTNPSPRIGFENGERLSLADRGPAGMVLALALVHHLAIGNNVPLVRLASWLRQLCTRLAIEFVPKTDPKVQELLAVREDVFPDYTEEGFEKAFQSCFDIAQHERIAGSERTLYLMRGR